MASKSIDEQKRIETGPMQVALLNEIAERLMALEKLSQAEAPEGIVEPIEKYTITDQRRVMRCRKAWFSISIINDGQCSVFAIVNTLKSFDEHEIMSGETYNIDMRRGLIQDVLMWCNVGEQSKVRIVGVR